MKLIRLQVQLSPNNSTNVQSKKKREYINKANTIVFLRDHQFYGRYMNCTVVLLAACYYTTRPLYVNNVTKTKTNIVTST